MNILFIVIVSNHQCQVQIYGKVIKKFQNKWKLRKFGLITRNVAKVPPDLENTLNEEI